MRDNYSRRTLCCVALLICSATVARAQEEARYKELPNFHRVNATLYRGAQPGDGGFKILVSLKIRAVINLRGTGEHSERESAEAKAAGLLYFSVPLEDFDRPTDEQVEQVLGLINAPENQPAFVHCRRGADRTGIVIACYRISHDRWTSETAKAEAKRYGMGFWQVKMKDYIRDYYRRRSERERKPVTMRLEQKRFRVV